MRIRGAWRSVREPDERLVGWALLLPGGRGVVIGSAFLLGVIVPVLLPCSVLVAAWAQGSGRRLGLLTDRRLVLLRASRGEPAIDRVVPLGEVRVRSGGEDGPVRVVAGSGRWLRAASNGVEPRFARAVRAMAGAEGSDAVC
jgi:hypothetical protein|tara:strand:- start:14095 stop:14520 length:426 start_codon:yes stop_codon:yes gene_type:complete